MEGKKLYHQRFAGDIVFVVCIVEAKNMLEELKATSVHVVLKNKQIEDPEVRVSSYKYLRHQIRIGRANQTLGLTWTFFHKLRHVFKSDMPVC